jgi:hypothetical protein
MGRDQVLGHKLTGDAAARRKKASEGYAGALLYVREILPGVCADLSLVAARQFAAALIMVPGKLTPEQIINANSPPGVPVIYRLNADTVVQARLVVSDNASASARRSCVGMTKACRGLASVNTDMTMRSVADTRVRDRPPIAAAFCPGRRWGRALFSRAVERVVKCAGAIDGGAERRGQAPRWPLPPIAEDGDTSVRPCRKAERENCIGQPPSVPTLEERVGR